MSLRQMTYLRAHISWACPFACTDLHFNISLSLALQIGVHSRISAMPWGNRRSRAGCLKSSCCLSVMTLVFQIPPKKFEA